MPHSVILNVSIWPPISLFCRKITTQLLLGSLCWLVLFHFLHHFLVLVLILRLPFCSVPFRPWLPKAVTAPTTQPCSQTQPLTERPHGGISAAAAVPHFIYIPFQRLLDYRNSADGRTDRGKNEETAQDKPFAK